MISIQRPLTQEEIAGRREQARQRHAEMRSANASVENETPLREQENKAEQTTKAKTHFMAFARVYSGTIRKGQQLYVLGPKHDPREVLKRGPGTVPRTDEESLANG